MNKDYKRNLDLLKLLANKSFFLLGPRSTGKTSLINQQLREPAFIINLLRSELFLRLSAKPHELAEIIEQQDKTLIVIDEIQLLPTLLNEVHRLIEEKGLTFLLTGSSARKLKHGKVNLLAGRAWQAELFVLTSNEITDFNINKYLCYGGLPQVYRSSYPEEELSAYTNLYLKEEVQAEALIRNVAAFSRFLKIAALTSGQMLNYANIASDTGIAASVVREYYQILIDTLIGFFVPAWTKSVKRKAITTAKFYLFDIGVRNHIIGINKLDKYTETYGIAFEHFIAMELRAYLSYRRLRHELTYWRSKAGHEVDFLLGDEVAIEVKTTDNITEKHLKNLQYLQEEKIVKKYLIVSFDKINRKTNDIEVLYWQDFLNLLWGDKVI